MAKITLANIRTRGAVTSDELLPGVKRNRRRYQVWISIDGVNAYIGSFKTNLDAGLAWLEAKIYRDARYLKEFEQNLLNDRQRLVKLKALQAIDLKDHA
jgi:cell division FtsZ-interacting protein ZapD